MLRCGWKVNDVNQMQFERYVGQIPIMVKVIELLLKTIVDNPFGLD